MKLYQIKFYLTCSRWFHPHLDCFILSFTTLQSYPWISEVIKSNFYSEWKLFLTHLFQRSLSNQSFGDSCGSLSPASCLLSQCVSHYKLSSRGGRGDTQRLGQINPLPSLVWGDWALLLAKDILGMWNMRRSRPSLSHFVMQWQRY